jgi:hypothetical protein
MSSKVVGYHDYLFNAHVNQGQQQSRLIKKPIVISNITVNNNDNSCTIIINNVSLHMFHGQYILCSF